MEKQVLNGVRKDVGRSDKPEPIRKVKVVPQLTDEQKDYLRYVLRD